MKIDEERLMAYADGELDPVARAQVAVAIEADPALAQVVAQHRALRLQLAAAFAPVVAEPVPARLQAAVNAEAAEPSGSSGDVPRPTAAAPVARAMRSRRPRWSPREWAAMAASLALGAALVLLLPRPPGGAMVDDALTAQHALSRALDSQLSGAHASGNVQVGLSFRTAEGGYCRAFRLQQARDLAGLACRADDGWQITTLTEAAQEAGGAMRQASTALPAAVLADIDARIDGEALDADAEQAARARGWR